MNLLETSHNFNSSITLSKKLMVFVTCFITLFISNTTMASPNTTQTGIPLHSEWQQKIYNFAQKNVKHSAWGIAHSERDYQLSVALAKKEGIAVDKEIIFAAAFLHDIGAIEPFRKKNVDHSVRSIEIVKPLLESANFPMQKWPKVKAAILDHMYYANRPTDKEAIFLHDADALDFFGSIGVVRLISITERHMWAPNLSGSFKTLQKFKREVPNTLITNTAKKLASKRSLEMDKFFTSLKQETFDGRGL